MGPNVKKLIGRRISMDAIPRGGSVNDAVRFLFDKDRISATAKSATKWVQDALSAVRTAAEPNPWKNATDEEIAGELLRQIADRERSPEVPPCRRQDM